MTIRRVPAISDIDVPHGGYCRLEDGRAYPQGEADGSGGISAGPATPRGYTPAGEALQLQTDGGIMTEAGYVQLRGGMIVA